MFTELDDWVGLRAQAGRIRPKGFRLMGLWGRLLPIALIAGAKGKLGLALIIPKLDPQFVIAWRIGWRPAARLRFVQ